MDIQSYIDHTGQYYEKGSAYTIIDGVSYVSAPGRHPILRLALALNAHGLGHAILYANGQRFGRVSFLAKYRVLDPEASALTAEQLLQQRLHHPALKAPDD